MQLIGLARLGQDIETRHTPSGEQVANLSLAFNYGRKVQDGKRPTQWVRASLWGEKRIAALADYLVKGQAVVVTLDDVHIEEFQKRDGSTGSALVGTVSNLELAGRSDGGGGQQQGAAPAAKPAPASAARPTAPPRSAGGGMGDMDDDIPF